MLTLKYVKGEKDYFKQVLTLIRKSKQKKVCYVTLNKSALALKEALKRERISPNRFYFIDGISAIIKKPKPHKNCEFIHDPTKLKTIATSIKRAIANGYTLVIFDSLSNLLQYGPSVPAGIDTLINFAKSFSPDLKDKKGKAIFLCHIRDREKLLIQETLPIFEGKIKT